MLDVVIPALALSSGLALAAAGITMIYMSTETFNFTHASMVGWAFYVMFTLHLIFGGSPYIYIPFAALFTGFLGVLIYITVNRWLLKANAGMVTLMMSTLGIDLILFGFLNVLADYLTVTFKRDARYFLLPSLDVTLGYIGNTEIKLILPVSLALVFVVLVGLELFLVKTKFGIAIRTTVENPTLAKVLGINPEMVYATSWFIGGVLAGLGGCILAMVLPGEPRIGLVLIVPLFAGSIVGGLYSIFGSLLGGFLIGMSQQLGIYLLNIPLGVWIVAYKPVIPLAIMAATLLLYPEGLGGLPWERIWWKLRSYIGGRE